MKYESYIRSLARYIRFEADTIKVFAERRNAEEQDLRKASFIEAITNIVFNLGNSRNKRGIYIIFLLRQKETESNSQISISIPISMLKSIKKRKI